MWKIWRILVNIYLFKVNYKNTQKSFHWCRSGVFIANFEHASRLFLEFLFLIRYGVKFSGVLGR